MSPRIRTAIASTAVLAAVAALAAAPAAQATEGTFQKQADSWSQAASMLGTAGSLWQPSRTLGTGLDGKIDVVASNLAFANGSVTSGDTLAGATYGTAKRGFQIDEKWADTGWAADPAYDTAMAPVDTVTIRLGTPGQRIDVKATVLANCWKVNKKDPQPAPKKFRCTPADVAKTGGVLQMTAKPASTMTAPGNTTVVIQSTGMTYRELIAVARGLRQVQGGTEANSAQAYFMCKEITGMAMTQAAAEAYAQQNGYTTRIGTVDGVPQAVTMDYRPDRLTLSTQGGVVVGCLGG